LEKIETAGQSEIAEVLKCYGKMNFIIIQSYNQTTAPPVAL
jgi:hypothetical protein